MTVSVQGHQATGLVRIADGEGPAWFADLRQLRGVLNTEWTETARETWGLSVGEQHAISCISYAPREGDYARLSTALAVQDEPASSVCNTGSVWGGATFAWWPDRGVWELIC